MEQHNVTIQSIENVTHDVLRIVTNKPDRYEFIPGQATEVAINKPAWQEKRRPFTFTNLPDDDRLEFTIKTYSDHSGVTNELLRLHPTDQLLIQDVFGAISYKGAGVFIAGGAGVTPFIAIFRDLQTKNQINGNTLLFANKTKSDIILEQDFTQMLGSSFVNILSRENISGYHHGRITEDFLKDNIGDFNQQFYVCGPPPMMEAVLKQLNNLGVDESAIVLEI